MSREKIEQWLTDRLTSLLGVDREDIDLEKSIFTYGLDSSVALSLTGELEVMLGLELDPILFWEYPKISELSEYLVAELAQK
ncbi:Acyl carrier protein [Microcystis aeruginosa NIES-2549]|uniref:Acyl carrier protein n=3 Tax=Microcystis aeruginosa TaxID=1126 RepID=A0A0F6U3H6_MICAE|nr:acyl carrier protein [Microcystis aeruginosa]AKE63896.1 Acyl carrier protein [Microcystis aeruginosa NIES-2549]AOC52285.1 Acyl carrier protein [Microcystis aeruginosa NIES-2481]GCA80053.1 phthiocerol synthesis polyketide synthase type I PpsA [Microcystis aeruginosa NIES-2521]GCL57267.1 phosphopantetheine-binding protein [Microcystis aeruginosa NIES-3807]